jgi:hypothetical protein
MLRQPQFRQPPAPSKGVGLAAAILGGLAAIGGVTAAVVAGRKPSRPMGRPPARPPVTKKPCGCGR